MTISTALCRLSTFVFALAFSCQALAVTMNVDPDDYTGTWRVAGVTADMSGIDSVDLAPGAYTVSEVLREGWMQSFPAELGDHAVTVRSGEVIEGLDFGNVTTFNLDEYVGLSVDHPASFAAFMRSHLFEPVGLGCERTHVPDGVLAGQDPEGAARAWEKLIRDAGGLDLQLLGLGRNGHVAFNEPGADRTSRTRLVALHEATISDNARFFSGADEVPARAITAGIATILEARKLVLMAFGAAKADAVRAVLHGPVGPEVPGSFVREHSDVEFWIDTEAAPPAELD